MPEEQVEVSGSSGTRRQGPRWVYPFGPGRVEPGGPGKDLLGGKGSSLAEMSLAGFPVPPGFTITTACCRAFFDNDEQWPAGLEAEVRSSLHDLEQAVGRSFGHGRHPLLVSVRSGASVSMPGMMDTLLNCGLHVGLAAEMGEPPEFWPVYTQFILMFARTTAGIRTDAFGAAADVHKADRGSVEICLRTYRDKTGRAFPGDPWTALRECISAVFRSWHTERAVTYRRRNGIRGIIGTAVNIQVMFPSEISGILFTQDPNDLAANRMVLESSYGLGEAVVSGDVDPDRFLVPRNDFAAFEAIVGEKSHAVAALGNTIPRVVDEPSLTPDQIAEIAAVGLRIEAFTGQPMDVEWGWADGKLALLQCRPIRGLEVTQAVEVGRLAEIERLRERAGDRRRVWVAHNLGETLRAPTPLTWDVVRRFMSGSGGFGRFYGDLGYRPSARVCREGFLELIGGRIYADPDRLAQLFWGDSPFRYDVDALLKDSSILDQAPSKFDPERADGTFFLKLPSIVGAMLRTSRAAKRLRGTVRDAFESVALPPYLDYVRRKRAQDLSSLDTPALCAELHDRRHRVLDAFGKESLKPGFFGAMAFMDMRGILIQLLGPTDGSRMAYTLTMGLEGDTTVAQNQLLYRVAHDQAPMEDFMALYGHRAVGEMELAEPRYREDPRELSTVLDTMRHGKAEPQKIHDDHARERVAMEAELPGLLAEWGGSSLRERIETSLRQTQALLAYRESGKHYLMMGYELIRTAILELAFRWDLGREIFFLNLDELDGFEDRRDERLEAAAQRRIRWQAFQRLEMADVIDSHRLENLGKPREYERSVDLQGAAVAAGTATGTARIVFDPHQRRDLGNDFVLVCPSTDPGWTSLFAGARGLIVERGGVLSHGAIVARDFGIPAVVCPDATRRIKDGARLRVDGNRGIVSVLEGG